MNNMLKQIQKNTPKVAKILKALANEQRLNIVCLLLDGERCVGDIWDNTKLSQSALSQHLAVLRREGIVKTQKQAQTVFYSLADDTIEQLLASMQRIFC